MKLENILYGVIGLLLGSIIGFMGANSINRSALSQAPMTGMPAGAGPNQGLPPNHPPIGTSGSGGDQQSGAAAIAEVSAAIDKAKSNPTDYEAQMAAADLYYQIQRFDEAAKFYEAAAKIKPADAEPLIKAGNSYFDSAETARENDDQTKANQGFAEAEKWYTQTLSKDPKNVAVRTDLGLTFFFREPPDLDRAIKEFKSSLSIQPEHETSLQNLASAYKEKGDQQNYRDTVEKLKKVNPNNPLFKETK